MKQFLFIILTSSLLAMFSSNLLSQETETLQYVPAEKLADYWITQKKPPPIFPRTASHSTSGACVTIMFIIESDGSTSNHRPVAVYPSSQFNQSSLHAAKQYTYIPAEKNIDREPVFTTNTFTFQISSGRRNPKNKSSSDVEQIKLSQMCTSSAEKLIKADLASADSN